MGKVVEQDRTMMHGNLDDLVAFACVARARSFTHAAAELGTSTSNLSHTIKRLEGRLGVRLLQRNSRSVSASEAGEDLLRSIGAELARIENALGELQLKRSSVSGTVRLTATREAYEIVIRPMLRRQVDANYLQSELLGEPETCTAMAAAKIDQGLSLCGRKHPGKAS